MRKRILAALATGVAVLTLAPARLGSAPASTTTTTTTTTSSNILDIPSDSAPNPLRLYPRRPGAKYEDVEARPAAAVTLGASRLRLLSWKITGRSLPHGTMAGTISDYQRLGLMDPYARFRVQAPRTLLHVVVHVKPTVLPAWLACVAVNASDGTVLLPFAPPPPAPPPKASTTTTGLLPFDTAPFDVRFDLPIGGKRGRFYLTCRNTLFAPQSHHDLSNFFETDGRAVWGLDV